MRVALVHERLTELGGSERVVAQLAALWPDATLHVPIAAPGAPMPGLEHTDVRTGWLQHLYGGGGHGHLLPLMPLALATTRVDADVVVTSHHAFANRVRVRPGTPIVSYTHTPGRWLWDAGTRRGERGGALAAAALGTFAATQRSADRRAAQRAHTIVANSSAVAERVRRWWGRDAVVVHPPVDTAFHHPDRRVEREDFFLLAGRLVPYKRPELAAAAAARAGVRLVVAGDGRARAAVEAAGGGHVRLLGRVSDGELRDLYRQCRALVFPGVEDFGIVPVEAMACGTPVLALGAGGALDTVRPGETGQLVAGAHVDDEAVVDAFAAALAGFRSADYDPAVLRAWAEGFAPHVFADRMRAIVVVAAAGRPAPAPRPDGALSRG